jgi:NAD+ synthase (glutamine-hydrolysing)
MRIALAQINTVVGDIAGTLEKITAALSSAAAERPDLIAFPEMCLTGYPPKDLVERPAFLDQAAAALISIEKLSAKFGGIGVIVGLPMASQGVGKGVVNVAALVAAGETLHKQVKSLLPTYDVFDEARYFDAADSIAPVGFKGETIGISICEDAWNDPELFGNRPYDIDPISILAQKGATIMINVSASPFSVGKEALRLELVRRHATHFGTPFIMINQVGGNDELVFDGRSYCVNAAGELMAALPMFEESVVTVDTKAAVKPVPFHPMDETEAIYRALVLGTRDYIHKCGFERAIVGLSGGIDSAVTVAIAAAALGAENVRAVTMPSPYSSQGSVDDSRALAASLGVALDVVPIGDVMSSYERALPKVFEGHSEGVAEENIQARIRGNILMAYSNKLGCLVLSTGNKSELAVGYCTLYGDMSGGLAVISDVPKMTVYRLADFINRDGQVIPRAVVDKAPSAELKPHQKDQDSLPPYETLDAILDLYIEDGLSGPDIAACGYDAKTVDWVLNAVRANEHKRKQAPPGLKVTSKAFGIGRRFPIAARYDV